MKEERPMRSVFLSHQAEGHRGSRSSGIRNILTERVFSEVPILQNYLLQNSRIQIPSVYSGVWRNRSDVSQHFKYQMPFN